MGSWFRSVPEKGRGKLLGTKTSRQRTNLLCEDMKCHLLPCLKKPAQKKRKEIAHVSRILFSCLSWKQMT